VTGVEGPVAGWLLTKLGPVGAWLKGQVRADHMPIAGRRIRPDHPHCGFYLVAAVAPSQSTQPLPLIDFMDRARRFVQQTFPTVFRDPPDYSGHELIRYRSADGRPDAQIISIYPSGLVEIQWLIAEPPATSLPMSNIIEPLTTLHRAVQAGRLSDLHQPRRLEGWRRVDWRVGVNGTATPREGGNSVAWSDVTAPTDLPAQLQNSPRPYCPAEGYAASRLTSLHRSADLGDLLAPVLEEHLAIGGYADSEAIRSSVAELVESAVELSQQPIPETLSPRSQSQLAD
jgi:hypothetical protein